MTMKTEEREESAASFDNMSSVESKNYAETKDAETYERASEPTIDIESKGDATNTSAAMENEGGTTKPSAGKKSTKKPPASDESLKLRLAPAYEPVNVPNSAVSRASRAAPTKNFVPGAHRYGPDLECQPDSDREMQKERREPVNTLQRTPTPVAKVLRVSSSEITPMTKKEVTDHIQEILGSTPVANVVRAKEEVHVPPTSETNQAKEDEEKNSKRWWIIAGVFALILIVVAIIVPHALKNNEDAISLIPPTPDTGEGLFSTVEEIKERGFLKCSLYATYVGFSRVEESVGIASGFNWDLCRAVAAVVLGDANAAKPFVATANTRFTSLKERKVDMVAMTTTHNMGRDVWEDNALVGASYTVPYVYTGMAFAGLPTFVECAERKDFFDGDCRDLKICVRKSTSYDGRLDAIFPGPEKVYADSHIENFLNLETDKCNVVVDSSAALAENIARSFGYTREYVLGDERFSKEPFALNTREDDTEWTSLVGLIMKALYTADMYGINKSNAAEPLDIYENMDEALKSIIVDSVSAVGNINELYERHLQNVAPRKGLNALNDGSSGLIYSFPLGKHEIIGEVKQGGVIESIRERGFVRCGVTRTDLADFDGETWTGMDIEFCRAVAAVLFSSGDDVEYIELAPSERLLKLSEGMVDLLAGERVTLLKGWHNCTFSPPYFYKNDESNDSYALATHQDDPQFNDMVFWTVMATFYAEEHDITNLSFTNMPLVNLFGEKFKPMFLDIVKEVGNYGEIYNKTMQGLIPRDGRNTLNNDSGPQQFAFPFF